MRTSFLRPVLMALLAASLLTACNPKYNWRDYNSPDAPYSVMFPDKPATHTRSIDLDGMTVNMTMTAVDIDGTMFAVGSAQAPDPAKAQAALAAMKTALMRNIGATATKEAAASTAVSGAQPQAALDVDAIAARNGKPLRLVGHFEARGTRFYQVIVLGNQKSMSQEQVDQFMSSFKLQ
jgi:hypothetical protein